MQLGDLKKAVEDLQAKVNWPPWNEGSESLTSKALSIPKKNSQDFFLRENTTSVKYINDWICFHVRGKIFLHVGCGTGERTFFAATAGAALAIGLNSNEAFVQMASSMAKKKNLDHSTVFLPTSCENTGLPNESVDVVVVEEFDRSKDLSFVFPELRRILKPGGKILYLMTLDMNPFIQVQKMAKDRKLKIGKPFKAHEVVDFAGKFFEVGEIRFWHLLATSVFYFANFKLQEKLLKILNPLDRCLVKLPGIRNLAWQLSLELNKKR